MLLTKIKNITTILVLAGFAAITIGAGFSAAGSNKGSGTGDDNVVAQQALPAPIKRRPPPPTPGTGLSSAETERAYTELKNDSLPAEARARFGNTRFLQPSIVGALTYSADGKLLASASTDGTVCIWDAANGKLLQTFNKLGSDGTLPPNGAQFGTVGGVAFSRDGKTLGSVVVGQGLRLWDVTTGKEIRTLFTGTQNLISFVMSPDGKLVYPVTESAKTIELYDAESGKVVKTLNGHTQNVTSVAFSSDGKWLVSGSEDQTVRIWDLETEKEKHVIEAHREGVKAVTVAPDDKSIASLSYDNTARVFDARTWEEVCRIEGRGNPLQMQRGPTSATLALSSDGKYLASYTMGWTPKLNEIPSGKEIYQFDTATWAFGAVGMAFRPDGKVIAHANSAGAIRFYDTATGKRVEDGVGHSGTPLCIAVSPDGKTLVSGGTDRTLRFWDLATNKEVRVIRAHTGAVGFVAFTPDGKHVISASTDASDKVISFWDGATGKEEAPIRMTGWPLINVALSPDGRKLCIATQDNHTHVWDIEQRKEISSIQTVRPGFPSMPFTPDSKGVLNFTGAGLVVVDVETGKEVRNLLKMPSNNEPQGGRVRGGNVQFQQWYNASLFTSADGALALQYSYDGSMQMMDMTAGTQLVQFEEKLMPTAPIPGRTVYGPTVAISPDGRTVATSWTNNSIRLWEITTGKVRHTFPGHAGAISALAFTRDGKALVSAATDSTILVWNVAAAAPAEALSDAELGKQWKALVGDGPTAFDAVRTLTAVGKQATAYLKEHVQPVKAIDDKTIANLLADLDSDDFEKRTAASESLTNLSEQVEPALRKALEAKPSLELSKRIETILHTMETHTLSDEQTRHLRAIEVLELCGTAEAHEVLEKLARGAETARVTREAKAALVRLDARREKKE
jgi:WD40 repeat protein